MNFGAPSGSVAAPAWVRLSMMALGAPNIIAGAWGLLSARGWFESFPGWDPRLLAAEPPFNAHLATDAAAGLFASGLILVGAAWLSDVRSIRLALVGFASFAIPHAAYHALSPAPGLTAGEDVLNATVLVVVAVSALVLFVAAGRQRESGS